MKDVKNLIKQIKSEITSSDLKKFEEIFNKFLQLKQSLTSDEDKKLFGIALRQLMSHDFNSLFPNEIPENAFGIPSSFCDAYSHILNQVVSLENVTNTAEGYNIEFDSKYHLSLKIDDKTIDLKNEKETIFEYLKDVISDPVVLQHYCALWNYAININKSFKFNCVKIDDILSTFLKKPDDGYFRKATRENFTSSVKFLQNIKLQVPVKISTKENKSEKTQYINFPLLNFSLSAENKDGTVILHFIGSMFGGSEFNKRGRIFPQGIFKLDSRKEGNRIALSFRLATRFDQQNQRPITYHKSQLLIIAGLSKTEKSNSPQATIRLKDTLNRLIEVKCISNYIWDDDKVIIYSYLHKEIEKLLDPVTLEIA